MGEKKNTSWLNKPYPLMENTNEKIWISVSFAVFIYLFLLLFQPFGVADIETSIPVYLLGFFFVTLLVMLFSLLALPKIFPQVFEQEKWVIKKSILFYSIMVLCIGILNWFYHNYWNQGIHTNIGLGYFMLITFAIGVFPSAFLVLISEKYLHKKHQDIAITMEKNIINAHKATISKEIIFLNSETEKVKFAINIQDLICIKSEGNYITVYFLDDKSEPSEKLLRNTLSLASERLKKFDHIKRCHRSYLVNFQKVTHVSGNARNYTLHFNQLGFTIPISRSFPKEYIDNLKQA